MKHQTSSDETVLELMSVSVEKLTFRNDRDAIHYFHFKAIVQVSVSLQQLKWRQCTLRHNHTGPANSAGDHRLCLLDRYLFIDTPLNQRKMVLRSFCRLRFRPGNQPASNACIATLQISVRRAPAGPEGLSSRAERIARRAARETVRSGGAPLEHLSGRRPRHGQESQFATGLPAAERQLSGLSGRSHRKYPAPGPAGRLPKTGAPLRFHQR